MAVQSSENNRTLVCRERNLASVNTACIAGIVVRIVCVYGVSVLEARAKDEHPHAGYLNRVRAPILPELSRSGGSSGGAALTTGATCTTRSPAPWTRSAP